MSVKTPHLTSPHSKRIDALLSHSFAGMAHWAGSGPTGKTCRQCLSWGGDAETPPVRYPETGELRPRRCSKFRTIMQYDDGATTPGVPQGSMSCRFFIENVNAKPAVALPKRAKKVSDED